MIVADEAKTVLLLALWAIPLNYIAWKKRFYTWNVLPAPLLAFKHVIAIFAIYLGTIFLVAPSLFLLLSKFTTQLPSVGFIVTVQFFIVLGMTVGIFAYCRSAAKENFAHIFKNPASSSSILSDLGLGILAWFIVFPIVGFIAELLDILLYLIFGLESYEQVAVRFLKNALALPSLTVLALISILILAPAIEEFLFRGCLQTYLKKRVGAKAAILLAAACFALFHYSAYQGLGNLSLLPSLFTFGCFLGFIFEKQGSLFASIGLHAAFNLASSLRILFFPE